MKLPRGMRKRGSRYKSRVRRNGKEELIDLGTDLREAREKHKRIRGESRDAIWKLLGDEKQPVEVLAKEWMEQRIQALRNEKGVKLTQSRLQRYFLPFFGEMSVREVDAGSLESYRRFLGAQVGRAGKRLATQTMWHILSDARCFFRWAVRHDHIEVSPFDKAEDIMPKPEKLLPRALSNLEVDALLELPEPYHFTIRLGLETGMRWGEVARAMSTHFDGKRFLHVPKAKSKSFRVIPITPEFADELRSRVGKLVPFEEHNGSSFLEQVRRRCPEVPRFGYHQLRHTYAIRWVEADRGIEFLQEVLGHADITTTMRYARVRPNHLLAALDRDRNGTSRHLDQDDRNLLNLQAHTN